MRRRNVARLYLQGLTQEEIAEQVGVDQATVSRDLEAMRKQLWGEAEEDLQELRTKELQRLSMIEEQAWEAWERSLAVAESEDEQAEGGAGYARSRERGNACRYLELAYKCSIQRRKLLGLDVSRGARESGRRQSPPERWEELTTIRQTDEGRLKTTQTRMVPARRG